MKLGIGEEATFEVDAQLEWNPSQVDLDAGQSYEIRAKVKPDTEWKDAGVESSLSKGWNWPSRAIGWLARRKARARHLPMYSLVGAIDQDGATFFLIGDGTRLVAPKAGELQAFANDWPGRYENNQGRAEVHIRRLG